MNHTYNNNDFSKVCRGVTVRCDRGRPCHSGALIGFTGQDGEGAVLPNPENPENPEFK